MDHAGEELERSAKLLHRAVARAHDQAREIGIMQSQVSFYVDMQGKGKGPLPLHSIPKTNNNSKTKNQDQQQNQNQEQKQQGRLHRRLDTPILGCWYANDNLRCHSRCPHFASFQLPSMIYYST